jgi:hypothetical protein
MAPRTARVASAVALVAAALAATACSGKHAAATTQAPVSTAAGALPQPTLRARLAACESADQTAMRACYTRTLTDVVGAARDPRPVIARITAIAWSNSHGFLLPNCHVMMHTVGRTYVQRHHVRLATMMDYLPQSNDPSCPAGFSHGLITGVAPQIDPNDPKRSARVCNRSATRYERYSCVHGFGHAFMRLTGEQIKPSLAFCLRLGRSWGIDCAGGVFHDYWLAVKGYDNTRSPAPSPVTNPRTLCAAQAPLFVKDCWYRSFLESRPPGFQTDSAAGMDGLCAGLRAVQRDACITAASVIGPPDPADQLAICAQFRGPDALSCIHGTKVQNLLRYPINTYVGVIEGCDRFAGSTRLACYGWLGKTISVVTNGRFRTAGCGKLAGSARRACVAGARSMNGPLETFS